VRNLPLAADEPIDPGELLGHPLIELDCVVEGVGDLSVEPGRVRPQAEVERAPLEGKQKAGLSGSCLLA
jgi:hypothetical protein